MKKALGVLLGVAVICAGLWLAAGRVSETPTEERLEEAEAGSSGRPVQAEGQLAPAEIQADAAAEASPPPDEVAETSILAMAAMARRAAELRERRAPWKVEGVVVESGGAPIADALVFSTLAHGVLQSAPAARSGPDGTFHLSGQYLGAMYADHPDYAPGWATIEWATIEPGQGGVGSVRIVLSKGGTVEGVVTVGDAPAAGPTAYRAQPPGSFPSERICVTVTGGGCYGIGNERPS